jgi:hypothetical protein
MQIWLALTTLAVVLQGNSTICNYAKSRSQQEGDGQPRSTLSTRASSSAGEFDSSSQSPRARPGSQISIKAPMSSGTRPSES